MRPFSPREICQYSEAPKTGPNYGPVFGRFSLFFEDSTQKSITVSLFAYAALHPTAQLLELLQIYGQRQQQCSVACNRTNVEKKILPQLYWGGPCGAHVFEGFFGLEDEPVKSVKMKVETRSGLWRLPHEFALCSLQFRFALRVSVMFNCVEPHPKKKLNPTNVRFRLKARGLLILNLL